MTDSTIKWPNQFSVSVSIALLAIFSICAFMPSNYQPEYRKSNKEDLQKPQTVDLSVNMVPQHLVLPAPPATAFHPISPTEEPSRKELELKPIKPSSAFPKSPNNKAMMPLGYKTLHVTKTKFEKGSIAQKRQPQTETKTENAPVSEGRVLLRMLEHDKGPQVSLAWPDERLKQILIFNKLKRCLDMRVALMTTDGKLFRLKENPGNQWRINLDRFSGFVRHPEGSTIKREEQIIRRIRSHHKISNPIQHVRIFPRSVDSALLSRIKNLIGPGYMKAKSVTARYQFSSGVISVTEIKADGREFPGRFLLPKSGVC